MECIEKKIEKVIERLDGWRYLEVSERVLPGDILVNSRGEEIEIRTGYVLKDYYRPVKRRV